jgi:hypothetical protein
MEARSFTFSVKIHIFDAEICQNQRIINLAVPPIPEAHAVLAAGLPAVAGPEVGHPAAEVVKGAIEFAE